MGGPSQRGSDIASYCPAFENLGHYNLIGFQSNAELAITRARRFEGEGPLGQLGSEGREVDHIRPLSGELGNVSRWAVCAGLCLEVRLQRHSLPFTAYRVRRHGRDLRGPTRRRVPDSAIPRVCGVS